MFINILTFIHSHIQSFSHSHILKLFVTFCLLALITIAGCKKDNNGGVPVVVVDITLYVNNPSYVNLNAMGGWVYVSGGVRGILVYRASSSEFKAYDRNCTYNSSDPCATVYVDATNILAVDTCCHSKFSLFDGSVTQGPATFPLKAYNTTFDGNILRIYN